MSDQQQAHGRRKTPKKSTSYFTHDNGARPFKVVVSSDQTIVQICTLPTIENDSVRFSPKNYTKSIRTYKNVQRVFVGKSPLNATTKFSGGSGKKFNGNSMLLKINCTIHKNYYVFIGDRIYGFSTPDDDPIQTLHSTVGNNDVPYPIALSKKYVYFMLDGGPSSFLGNWLPWHIIRVDRSDFPKRIVWSDAHSYYYEKDGVFPSAKRIYIKMIQEPIW